MKRYKQYLEAVPLNFKSDGCTMAPDLNIRKCCVMHDHLIATRPGMSRHYKDTMFRECVEDTANPVLAWIYFLGVRIAKLLGLTKLL